MNLYKHVVEQPFVMATGLAALVHSTWSLGTLFAGKQPEQIGLEYAGWLLPAFLIAFAMDVGQIMTSAEIRAGHRTRIKYVTFMAFAVATYYLQWLYMAHHMPALELAGGVRGEWSALATLVRDAAVWIVPGLMPLSTLLYTFSSDHAHVEPVQSPVSMPEIVPVIVEKPKHEALPAPTYQHGLTDEQLSSVQLPTDDGKFFVFCKACGEWEKTYDNPNSAAKGLATHLSRHCKAMHPAVSANGNGNHS